MRPQVLTQELTAPGYTYDAGLRDQNAIVYVLKTQWAEHSKHVALVNSEYCLNCYWRDLLQEGDLASSDKRVSAFSGLAVMGEPVQDLLEPFQALVMGESLSWTCARWRFGAPAAGRFVGCMGGGVGWQQVVLLCVKGG
jgi:hypothetical protein